MLVIRVLSRFYRNELLCPTMAQVTIRETAHGVSGDQWSSRTGTKNLQKDTTNISFEIPTALLGQKNEELIKSFIPLLLEKVAEIKAKHKKSVPDQAKHEILQMVGRIDGYATGPSSITLLWEDIIDDDMLGHTLLYQCGKKKSTPNPSRIIAIVGYLRNRGFYTDVTDLLSLSKVLLVASERPQYYNNSHYYLLKSAEETRMGLLMKKNKKTQSSFGIITRPESRSVPLQSK